MLDNVKIVSNTARSDERDDVSAGLLAFLFCRADVRDAPPLPHWRPGAIDGDQSNGERHKE